MGKWTERLFPIWRWNGRGWHVQLNVWWKLADLWVGVFVKPSRGMDDLWRYVDVYVCLVPCFPLHVHFWWDLGR